MAVQSHCSNRSMLEYEKCSLYEIAKWCRVCIRVGRSDKSFLSYLKYNLLSLKMRNFRHNNFDLSCFDLFLRHKTLSGEPLGLKDRWVE